MFESNDTFVEDAVKVVETPQDKTRKLGLMAMCLVTLGGFTVMDNHLKYIFLIAFIVLIVIDLFLIVNNKNVEYEYDYTNGSLEIAKIIDNSKRKKLLVSNQARLRWLQLWEPMNHLGLTMFSSRLMTAQHITRS
ncbi:hypothetical protein CIY_29780 [Butyrivibrio fibrisolvens 16/4]|nr:hypothetical protein CIY_29780 [Butyrivibrio fibrisolvens 16/4]